MKINSANLSQVKFTKDPNRVAEVLSDTSVREFSLAFSEFKVEKLTRVLITMKIKIFSENKANLLFEFESTVVVSIELETEEIKNSENIKPKICHYAVRQAWPLFQSKIDEVDDFKVGGSIELPPPPTEEDLRVQLQMKSE